MGDDWDLDEASEFLVVAATLLDLKAARLLPAGRGRGRGGPGPAGGARPALRPAAAVQGVQGGGRAYIAELEAESAPAATRARSTLEPRYAEALPDLVLGIGPERLAELAVEGVDAQAGAGGLDRPHPHGAGQRARARRDPAARSCSALRHGDVPRAVRRLRATLEVVARFLALLELYREGLVAFDQVDALDELTVRWTGGDGTAEGGLDLDIDEYAGTPLVERDPPSAGAGAIRRRPTATGTGDRTAERASDS